MILSDTVASAISQAVLEVDGLSFRYRDAADDALSNITYRQESGEFAALVGPSGAGKSTFCRCISRIIPTFHNGDLRGRVHLCGESIAGKAVHQLVPRIGIVFQDFESQLFSTNVAMEVAFGLENLGVDRAEMERRVVDALALAGLSGLEDRDPATLSGGQKQRLAIASVLAMAPAFLVMDEPTTDLDPTGRAEIMRLARRLKGSGTAMLITDHEVDDLLDADTFTILCAGKTVASGATREVLRNLAPLEQAGVRPPQVPAFFQRAGAPELPITVEEGYAFCTEHHWHINREQAAAMQAAPDPQSADPLIAVQHLSYAYPSGIQALHEVNLTIHEGEILAILGQNGCGKTTLAKHLNGLLAPGEGTVLWENEPLQARRLSEMARHVGYIFQNPDHQIFAQTVREEVEFGPRNLGVPAAELVERVASTLAAVGLQGQEESNPFTMSKGERQRVAVASVLAAAPEVIVLDEPTTGLDFRQQVEMMALIQRLHAAGRTIILITHSMWIAAEYAQRCVVMAGGQIIADAPTRQVFGDAHVLEQAHLRPPSITDLGNRLGFTALNTAELLTCLERG